MLKKNLRVSLTLMFCTCLLWFLMHANDARTPKIPADKMTLREMAGTWTDPAGPKDNCISFIWTQQKDKEGDLLAAICKTYLTSGTVRDLFGAKDIPITFGFRSHAPTVRVFVTTKGKEAEAIVEVKAIDHQHLRVQVLNAEQSGQQFPLLLTPGNPVVLTRSEEPKEVLKW